MTRGRYHTPAGSRNARALAGTGPGTGPGRHGPWHGPWHARALARALAHGPWREPHRAREERRSVWSRVLEPVGGGAGHTVAGHGRQPFQHVILRRAGTYRVSQLVESRMDSPAELQKVRR